MSDTQALVLAGHGSQRHARSAAPLHAHADRIRESGRFDEVRTAFWKEEPTLREVTATVSSDVAYVVPVLTSEGYFADEVFPRELGVDDGGTSTSSGVEVRYTEPVGTHDAITDVIAARVESAIRGARPDVGVAVVGHGTERHERSARSTVEHARRLRESERYAEVGALFLDEEPHVGDLYDRLDADELVVVPLFVADGSHTTRDVPDAIGHPGVGESATVDGRAVHYAGAVGTEPSLAEVIVERAVEAGATVEPQPVSETAGPTSPRGQTRPTAPDEAFLRRVDASSEGIEWGELSIASRPGGYELRHSADVEASRDTLDALDRPRDLREAVRTDDHGRYRPLSGAETLPTGWVLDGLGPDELVRAARFVYPGSITHWWNEREGEIEVTDFQQTVDRQTGIYADLGGFDGAALDAAAEAVCGDCVRRRCWEAGEDEPIDAPRADGDVPCREACPFFLSAAHAFDRAIEEGSVDPAEPVNREVPAGALEVPGNRYRVRFARALLRRSSGEPRGGDAEPVTAPSGGERR